MNTTRQLAGRMAKLFGHAFEEEVKDYLTMQLGKKFILEGSNNTKVDIRSEDNELRVSLKKTPTGLQAGLITQQNFINTLNIKDPEVLQFISEFFGGDEFTQYPRHRKRVTDIDSPVVTRFLEFLHESVEDIFRVAITHGSLNQHDDVNFIFFPTTRHNVTTLKKINTASLLEDIKETGTWRFNPTTIDLLVEGIKIMNIQMFGSGKKYSSGYHSLQFRITCGKVNSKHVHGINT